MELDRRSMSSDGETHALEVVFEDDAIHRRKSSLVPTISNIAPTSARPGTPRRKTQCFVHALLEKQDRIPTGTLTPSSEGLAGQKRMDKDSNNEAPRITEGGAEGDHEAVEVEEDKQTHHSRLLTKKQISDMAFGIRELSKKLAQIRLRLHVKNIFILGKAHDETLIYNTREVTEWLLGVDTGKLNGDAEKNGTGGSERGGKSTSTSASGGYRVYVEDTMEHNKIFDAQGLSEKHPEYKGRLRWWNNKLCAEKPQTFDIVLAVRLLTPIRLCIPSSLLYFTNQCLPSLPVISTT